MIVLERERTIEAIPASFRGRTPRNRLVALMKLAEKCLADGKPVNIKIASKWSVVKEQLFKETKGKCAYCETPTSVNGHGDVEHYRPKSIYWWLAYVYDNYLVTCAVCNQSFKGAQFELSGSPMTPPNVTIGMDETALRDLAKTAIPDPLREADVAAFKISHKNEKPLIPNPYFDNPEEIFAWELIDANKEVNLIAANKQSETLSIVDAVERIYGLNRPELRRQRYKWYKIYEAMKKVTTAGGISTATRDLMLELIDSYKQPDSQYAAMIRYFETL